MRKRFTSGLMAITVLLALPAAAAAHVGFSADSTASGGYAYGKFSVPHGCEEKATTKIEISIPEEILSYKPQVNPGWDMDVKIVDRDPVIKGAHGDITERVDTVTYTAKTPLPDGYLDVFGASIQWPEDADGDTLMFPVIQTCEGGAETAWIEEAKEGEDEPESPAPSITLTAAGADAHGGDKDDHSDKATADDDHAASDDHKAADKDIDDVRMLAVVGVVLGALSLLLLLFVALRMRSLKAKADK